MIDWVDIASRVGVPDTSAFRRCLGDDEAAVRLHSDSLAAEALGITGTPLILINGWRIQGSLPEKELDELISRALKERQRSKAAG